MRHTSHATVASAAAGLLLAVAAMQTPSRVDAAQGANAGREGGATPAAAEVSQTPCVGQISGTRPVTDVFKPGFTHLTGAKANDSFGVAVASGDIDHDGFSDIVVGARGDFTSNDNKGLVYIYKGSKAGLVTTPALVLESEQPKSEFGRTLIAGDINGDGYADVIVGAHGFNGGVGSHQGKVYVYLGGPKGLATTPSQTLLGEVKGGEFGRTFDIVDVNGDGINDLLLGASGYGGDLSNQGKAYVYLGTRTGLDSRPYFTAVGEKTNDEFGRAISAADVNGDGFTDLVIASTGGTGSNNSKNTVPGSMYVYYGSAKGFGTDYSAKFDGEFPKGHLGEGMFAVGDLNHDGYADIAIGARDFACGGGVAGKVYAYLGGPKGLSADRVWTAVGIGDGGVGRSIAPAGDLDGDGYQDFLSGAPVGTVDKGAGLYMFFGGAKNWGSKPVVINANDGENAIGFGLFSAGDVNGDSAPDIVVGARDGGDAKQGWARVYYGKKGSLAIKR